MQVYIFRHGIAEDAAAGQTDAERRLTEKGRGKLQKILARAREAGAAPEAILTSPLLRARQTAEMAKEQLAFEGELIETGSLVPSSNAFTVWEEVRTNFHDAEQVMLVGHNPLLSDLVCFLTGTPAYGVGLKKGAIALVEVEQLGPSPRGMLLWLLTAKTAGA